MQRPYDLLGSRPCGVGSGDISDPIVVYNQMTLYYDDRLYMAPPPGKTLRVVRKASREEGWEQDTWVYLQSTTGCVPTKLQFDDRTGLHYMPLDAKGPVQIWAPHDCIIEVASPLGSDFAASYKKLPRELQLNVQGWLARATCDCPIIADYTAACPSFDPYEDPNGALLRGQRAHGDPYRQGLLYPLCLGATDDKEVDFYNNAIQLYYSNNRFLVDGTDGRLGNYMQRPPDLAFLFLRRLEVAVPLVPRAWSNLRKFCRELEKVPSSRLEHLDINISPFLCEFQAGYVMNWTELEHLRGLLFFYFCLFMTRAVEEAGDDVVLRVPFLGQLHFYHPFQVTVERHVTADPQRCCCVGPKHSYHSNGGGDLLDSERQNTIEATMRASVQFKGQA